MHAREICKNKYVKPLYTFHMYFLIKSTYNIMPHIENIYVEILILFFSSIILHVCSI